MSQTDKGTIAGLVRDARASRMRSFRRDMRLTTALCMMCCVSPGILHAQTSSSPAEGAVSNAEILAEMRAMRAEIRSLKVEVDGLRKELHQSPEVRGQAPVAPGSQFSDLRHQSGTPTARMTNEYAALDAQAAATSRGQYARPPADENSTSQVSSSDSPGAGLADSVSMLQSQVAEQAQTKVESASKMPVKVFGTILSATFFNSGPTDWADVPSVVNSWRDVPSSTGSFSSSLRQSRVGLMIGGPTIGSMKVSGTFAVDFLGGSADFQSGPLFGLPHLLYGYVRLDGARTAIEAGQDELILAPHHPTSLVALAFPELFRAGDLYDRAPQVRVEQELAETKKGTLRATLGLVAPVANYPGLDFPGAGLTETWQRPAVQGRLEWQSAESSSGGNNGLELGLAGHFGRVRVGHAAAPSWAGVLDFGAHRGRFGVDGEGYLGQNLESFGGGLGQPGKTSGGYMEGSLTATQRLSFNTGFGTDHLNSFEFVPVDLNRNTGIFANTIFQFSPELAASFEFRHMITRPFSGPLRRNEHVDVGLAYSF